MFIIGSSAATLWAKALRSHLQINKQPAVAQQRNQAAAVDLCAVSPTALTAGNNGKRAN